MAWRKRLTRVTAAFEDLYDDLKKPFSRLDRDTLNIIPYIGYATPHKVVLRGRVIQGNRLRSSSDNDNLWDNVLNMWRRFATDEIAGAVVDVRVHEMQAQARTDEEGFFLLEIPLAEPLPAEQTLWQAHYQLLAAPGYGNVSAVNKAGKVIVPGKLAHFGIISDLDDTVLKTNVLQPLRMAQNTFLENARTRLPFPGVAAFYQALQVGSGESFNPIFYVSSSPINLYDLLVEFFQIRGIPDGPVFLQDIGFSATQWLSKPHGEHKLAFIKTLFEDFPSLPFILIGDSGQKDPEIYSEVIRQYPGRVAAIYIRHVSNATRKKSVLELINEAAKHGVEMLLVNDTLAAAQHAFAKGTITEAALRLVEAESEADR